MIELHYDSCYDLLSAEKRLIYVDNEGIVRGQTQHELKCEQDIMNMASKVENRSVRATNMNDRSSRAHCITTFKLTRLQDCKILVNKFTFVDLAGSERVNEALNPLVNNKNTIGA